MSGNLTDAEIDAFLTWASAENDRIEAELDHARGLLEDPHGYQPHRDADGRSI